MMSPVNLSHALEHIPGYLKLSSEDLEGKTVVLLRDIAKNLGITGISRARKSDLITHIDVELDRIRGALEEKEEASQIVEANSDRDYVVPVVEVATKVYGRLREVVTTASDFQKAKDLVNGIAGTLASQEKSDYESFGTRKARRYDIKEHLSIMASKEGLIQRDMEDIIKYFYEQLLTHMREESKLDRVRYDRKVKSFHQNLVEIKALSLYQDSLQTLELLPSELEIVKTGGKPKRGFWKSVSHALILGTGRRMCEIHALGKFEATGEYRLRFSGQAKTKDSEGAKDNYEIPTLFPAELMVKGLQYLEACDRRIPKVQQENNRNATNKRFSVQLSRHCAKYKSLIGEDSYTYEESRKVYFQTLWGIFQESETKVRDFIKCSDWLGHQDKDGKTDTTFLSYMKYTITDLENLKGILDSEGILKDAVAIHNG